MRALSLTLPLAITCAAAAQSVPVPTVAVIDENGVAVPDARVFLQMPSLPILRCQTDFAGRCRFPRLALGQYHLRVKKEGFYELVQPSVRITPSFNLEVALSHQREVREIVDVH